MNVDYQGGGYEGVVHLMRALAHPVRLQILEALLQGPAYVGDLIALTGQRQAYVSQQLMVLRTAGLVESTRTDQRRSYRLTQPALHDLIHLARIVCPRAAGAAEEAAAGANRESQ